MGVPPSAHGGWRGQRVGKGAVMVATPGEPLNNDALPLWCPRLLPQTFLIAELLTPVPSGCLFTASSCPLPGSTLQTHFPALSPPLHQETHDAGWGVQGCGTGHVHSSYSVLPSTDHLLRSPPIPWRSLSVPADFPPVRGFSECGDLPSPSAPHQGCWSLPDSSFLSFILPSGEGTFLVLLGVRSLPLMFSRCSVRTVPFVDVLLTYLWGETNSASSYSTILTSPPRYAADI